MNTLNYRRGLSLIALIVFSLNSWPAAGQYYYVNSYAPPVNGEITSAIYKIDLASKRVVDSLCLDMEGEFITNRPIEISRGDHSLIVAFLNSGLAGKNSSPRGISIARYVIINKNEFRILYQDSLPNYFIYDNMRSDADSIMLEWSEDAPGLEGHYIGRFIQTPNDNRIRLLQRQQYREELDNPNVIGVYSNSTLLFESRQSQYYWGLRAGLEAVLFRTDRNNNILAQTTVGDKNTSSVLIGYNL